MKLLTTEFGLRYIIPVFLLASTPARAQSSRASFLTNGLVAYYPFSGNANDLSGNGNHGMALGATLTTDRFGSPASAYDFKGTNSYIDIPQNPVLNSLADLTLAAWIWQRGPISDTVEIIGKDSSGVPNGWMFDTVVNCNPGVHVLRLQAAGAGPCNTVGGTEYSLTEWHQIVATISNTVGRVYLDGKLDGLGDIGNIPLNTLDIFIGRGHPSTRDPIEHYWFDGVIDDVRIYNRALSPAEVQQLHQIESEPSITVTKAVRPNFSNLIIGAKYQLEISSDSKTWSSYGAPFTATNASMVYPQYWDVNTWDELIFQLQSAQ
jgi:hypothetical protein